MEIFNQRVVIYKYKEQNMSVEYEFNSVVFSCDDIEFTVGVVPQLEPFLRSLPQPTKAPRRRYRRKNRIMVSELIDEFIDDISA